jgi:hypothetical protein
VPFYIKEVRSAALDAALQQAQRLDAVSPYLWGAGHLRPARACRLQITTLAIKHPCIVQGQLATGSPAAREGQHANAFWDCMMQDLKAVALPNATSPFHMSGVLI